MTDQIPIDMFEGFDELDDPPVTEEQPEPYEITETPRSERLSPELWGTFCLDLILNPGQHDDVCKAFGIEITELQRLLELKPFTDRLGDLNLQVKTLGPNAGFVLAARAQAEKHLVTLGNIAENSTVHPGVRVKAVENLVRYAHLDPQTQKQTKENEQRSSSPGVLVQFNIGGGLLGSNKQTLEVQGTVIESGYEAG